MGSSLLERAALYRRLADTLTNPDDVDAAYALAEQYEDIARLELPIYAAAGASGNDSHWLQAAISRIFHLPPVNPPLLEVMFNEVVSDGASFSEEQNDNQI